MDLNAPRPGEDAKPTFQCAPRRLRRTLRSGGRRRRLLRLLLAREKRLHLVENTTQETFKSNKKV
eukprot:COSAG06_NODE_1256_length_10087_cov_7.646676_5_plen_65_part_00